MKIQRIWRGHVTRRRLQPQIAEAKIVRAVVKIQRQVRCYMFKTPHFLPAKSVVVFMNSAL